MSNVSLEIDDGLVLIGRRPARAGTGRVVPDWIAADPRKIRSALQRASRKPSGGWAVLDASRSIATQPRAFTVDGLELVAWRCAEGRLRVAPDACPHMGASLSCGRVDREGRIVCPWHGLALGERHGAWAPLPAHDDGVLAWVQLRSLLAPGETPTPAPLLPARPLTYLDAVIRTEARCAPEDVIANRLDPWHGTHFHPHSFARLRVIEETEDSVTARVVYRIASRVGVEVDARFSCPDPRTIVMTIVDGEGTGSVVETHASPIGTGRTAIIEATLAYSSRREMSWLPSAGVLLRGLVRARAARLWEDDARYCERTYSLRTEPRRLPIHSETDGPIVDAE